MATQIAERERSDLYVYGSGKKHRLVITGVGGINSLGVGVQNIFNAMLKGNSGVRTIDVPPEYTQGLSVTMAARLPDDFNPLDHGFKAKDNNRAAISTLIADMSATEAFIDSNHINTDGEFAAGLRKAVVMGTSAGGMLGIIEEDQVLRAQGDGRHMAFTALRVLTERGASYTSMSKRAKGPVFGVTAACATGAVPLTLAEPLINYNYAGRGIISPDDPDATDADIVIAGATEVAAIPFALGTFASAKTLSRNNEDPEGASRPFDRDRDGFVLGEGAAVMIVEPLEHALARGAKIYAELAGVANTADAHHETAPDNEGVNRIMRLALRRAGITPAEVGWIKTHGTGTFYDYVEGDEIFNIFGGNVPISSQKGFYGHMVGAAGAMEIAMVLKAMEAGVILANRNLDNPYRDDIDFVLPVAVDGQLVYCRIGAPEYVLCNAFGFGGLNTSIVLKRYIKANLLEV